MKKLNCISCGKYIGEIEKGRLLKGTVCLCTVCANKLKVINKKTNRSLKDDVAVDFLKNMFNIT